MRRILKGQWLSMWMILFRRHFVWIFSTKINFIHWKVKDVCSIVADLGFAVTVDCFLTALNTNTRSTQRAQTSLAEADHYSHIAHCKNVEPWLWKTTHPLKKKKKKKVLDHYLHDDLGMLPLLWCFFAHLLILQYPDHHQNLISSSFYYSGPVHKISSQSVHNFLSNVVHIQTNKQTNRQTNQRYQKHKLLCQGGNKSPIHFVQNVKTLLNFRVLKFHCHVYMNSNRTNNKCSLQ